MVKEKSLLCDVTVSANCFVARAIRRPWGWVTGWLGRGHEEYFWHDKNTFYVDEAVGFMCVHECAMYR